MNHPVNQPESFGKAQIAKESTSNEMSYFQFLSLLPESDSSRQRPGIKRVFSGPGVNLILATFLPGQSLPDHSAIHPITVQCLAGSLSFTCGIEKVVLSSGDLVHVPAHVVHRVDYLSGDKAIMLLSMLT